MLLRERLGLVMRWGVLVAVAIVCVGGMTTRPIKSNTNRRSHRMIGLVTTSVTLVSSTTPLLGLVIMLLLTIRRPVRLLRRLARITVFLRRLRLLIPLEGIAVRRIRGRRGSTWVTRHWSITLPIAALLLRSSIG